MPRVGARTSARRWRSRVGHAGQVIADLLRRRSKNRTIRCYCRQYVGRLIRRWVPAPAVVASSATAANAAPITGGAGAALLLDAQRPGRLPTRKGPLMARTDSRAASAPEAEIPPPSPQLDGSAAADDRAERHRQRAAGRAEQPQGEPQGMIPARERRRTGIERGAMRLIATGGIIGVAVLLGAVLGGQDVAGWIVGLVVGLVSVGLAALLWSSRQL